EIDDQRADLGAQEMVRAGRAEASERLQLLRIDEFEHGRLVIEMTELALALADPAADFRHQPRSHRTALRFTKALCHGTAKDRLAFGLAGKPFDRLIDDFERQEIAIPGVVRPGEEAMAFQHDALRS